MIAREDDKDMLSRSSRANAVKYAQTLLAIAILVLFVTNSWGGSEYEKLDSRIVECDTVLKKSLEMPDGRIPKELLQRCRGLAIFPKVWNVGAFVGIGFGTGIALRRDEKTGEWSHPAFFSIKQGSLGVQMGAQSIDLILLMMSEKTIQKLLEEKLTLGIDASVSAGPVGRDAGAETNLTMESGVLSYSRSKGLFMGVALSGSILEPDMSSNEGYHGKGVSVQDVLYGSKGALSDAARNLVNFLDEATR